MTRGGARVNSGPPPDPNALRRDRADDKAGWVTIPAGGRTGRTPRWPLLADPSNEVTRTMARNQVADLELDAEVGDLSDKARKALERDLDRAQRALLTAELKIELELKLEKAIWRDLWRTPQATQWERLGWNRDVAVYARHRVRAELGSLDDAKEARQWSDRLGLNPAAMLRLRWRVSSAAPAAAAAPRTGPPKRPSSRDRFTVHDGGREA